MSVVVAAKMVDPPIQLQSEPIPEAPSIGDTNPFERNDSSNSSGSKRSKKDKDEFCNEKNSDNEEVNSDDEIADEMARVRPSHSINRRRPSGSAVFPSLKIELRPQRSTSFVSVENTLITKDKRYIHVTLKLTDDDNKASSNKISVLRSLFASEKVKFDPYTNEDIQKLQVCLEILEKDTKDSSFRASAPKEMIKSFENYLLTYVLTLEDSIFAGNLYRLQDLTNNHTIDKMAAGLLMTIVRGLTPLFPQKVYKKMIAIPKNDKAKEIKENPKDLAKLKKYILRMPPNAQQICLMFLSYIYNANMKKNNFEPATIEKPYELGFKTISSFLSKAFFSDDYSDNMSGEKMAQILLRKTILLNSLAKYLDKCITRE